MDVEEHDGEFIDGRKWGEHVVWGMAFPDFAAGLTCRDDEFLISRKLRGVSTTVFYISFSTRSFENTSLVLDFWSDLVGQ